MARLNLSYAAAARAPARRTSGPADYAALGLELEPRSPAEVEAWERAARAMHVPYDDGAGHHTRRTTRSSSREVWDLDAHAAGAASRCCCTTTRSSSTATRCSSRPTW